jgi:hypothetical protein
VPLFGTELFRDPCEFNLQVHHEEEARDVVDKSTNFE